MFVDNKAIVFVEKTMRTAVIIVVTVAIILFSTFSIGWVVNIVQFVDLQDKSTFDAKVRALGIPLIPLGVVLGYHDLSTGTRVSICKEPSAK